MLSLWLILLLVWVSLVVILWGASLWLQGYIYSEPEPELYWRAPAAGSALALFIALWCFLDYGSVKGPDGAGSYQSLFDITTASDEEFPELKVKERDQNKYETYYLRKNARGFSEYRSSPQNKPLPSNPPEIIGVTKDKEEDRFEPERDQNGNFKRDRGKALRYLDSHGRVMMEDSMGTVSNSHTGLLVVNFLINLLFLGLWFVCLWLLLRFEWAHALLGAVVIWVLMILVIMPMLLGRAETVARQRQSPGAQAAVWADPCWGRGVVGGGARQSIYR